MAVSFKKNKINITLLENVHDDAVETLKNAGYTSVKKLSTALDEEALIEALQDTHMVGIRSRTQLTERVVKACPKLMAIGCFCIGTNQVNKDAAAIAGIPVFNAPFSNTRSVAELVIGEMIMLMRGIFTKSMAIHQDGTWLKSATDSFEVRGKTLGIIGYGHIGSQVAILAEGLGLNVQYFDIEPKLSLGNHTAISKLDDLLKTSDIITLHVPETTDTKGMIGKKEIAKMKDGAYLVNASRGTVVDIEALANALKKGTIKGAAIDVFPTEPKAVGDKLNSPLCGLENVILTPHIGGSTKEAQQNIAKEVANKFVQYSDTGATLGAVNFPQVNLPAQMGAHRLLHIHQNKAGVLNALNEVLAKQNINIVGQYLHTAGAVGYVVTDVAADASALNMDAIQSVDGTIRTRILY